MNVLNLVELVVGLLALCVAVSLISLRLRVPYTLALVVAGLGIGLAHLLPGVGVNPDLILFLFLPALLFEGAWSLDLHALAANGIVVFLFAVPGLLLTLLIVAVVLHLALGLPWLLALLLGAMLSPTDPVAVLALFRQLRMPQRLRVILEGESLFNDGIGAAVFEIVLGPLLAALGLPPEAFGIGLTDNAMLTTLAALWLVFGGLGLGVLVAWLLTRLLTLVDNFLYETALTFTVAYGVYLAAALLHASGILAVIGAGLVLGSASGHGTGPGTEQSTAQSARRGIDTGMSPATIEAASNIWQFTGYLANSFLFLLLGLQLSAANLIPALPAIAWAVVAVFAGRALMIALSLRLHDSVARWLALPLPAAPIDAGTAANTATRSRRHVASLTATLRMRWRGRMVEVPRLWRPLLLFSGLRGALSIALVLSLPAALPQLSLLETIVYGVVLVTLVGQGFLLRLVLPHWPMSATLPTHTTRDNMPPVAPISE